MEVYKSIAHVIKALSKEGIAKGHKNQQQNYSFRGIDDVYNALAPFLAEAELCILPRYLDRSVTERETSKGGLLFSVVVQAEFDFVSAKDGSKHTIKIYGEAMDSGDKGTNKAMSAAFKYACMQAFCIPTEGDNDADSTTHQPVKRKEPEPEQPIADIPDALIPIFDELHKPGHVTTALGDFRARFEKAWPTQGIATYQRILTAHGIAKGQITVPKVKSALIEMYNVLKQSEVPA